MEFGSMLIRLGRAPRGRPNIGEGQCGGTHTSSIYKRLGPLFLSCSHFILLPAFRSSPPE